MNQTMPILASVSLSIALHIVLKKLQIFVICKKMKLFCAVILIGVAAAAALVQNPIDASKWSNKAVDLVAVVGTKLFFKAATNENVPFGAYLHFCHSNDMQTATIETSTEQAAIQGYMVDNNVTGGYWLGGWKINHEGNWTWISGERELLYTHWMDGQPNGSKNHSCIWFASPFGEWRESRCTDTWVPFCHLRV